LANFGVRRLRAPRATHVSGTDEKRIRIRNTVMDKNNPGLGCFSSKIADCARTGRRPRKLGCSNLSRCLRKREPQAWRRFHSSVYSLR
jgi:hypothetical protein